MGFCFCFLTFIGVWLIYNIVLVSDVQKRESVICMHISTFFFRIFSYIRHYTVLSRVPCAIQQVLNQLSILYIVVCVCQSQSLQVYPSCCRLPHIMFLISHFTAYTSQNVFRTISTFEGFLSLPLRLSTQFLWKCTRERTSVCRTVRLCVWKGMFMHIYMILTALSFYDQFVNLLLLLVFLRGM